MEKKERNTENRTPKTFNSIQVNFCKNPMCSYLGIPSLQGRENVNRGSSIIPAILAKSRLTE